MQKILLNAGALALALVPAWAANATSPIVGLPITAPTITPTAIYCDDGAGNVILCTFGGGGPVTIADGADATTGAKADTAYTGSGAASLVAIGKSQDAQLRQIVAGLTDTSPSLVKFDQTTPGTTNGVYVNSSVLPTGAATSANQATLNATIGIVGSNAPTSGIAMVGIGPNGKGNLVQTSTSGGLLPGQSAPTSVRTPLTANSITLIDTARASRLLLTVQVDGSPAAPIYLCFNGQSTTCSATTYDIKIATAAADGAIYTAPFGMTGAIYAFSTAAAIVNVSSWVAQ